MVFCCNFDAIVKITETTFFKALIRQCIGMAMLLVFVLFQWFQFYHYHPTTDTTTSNSKTSQLYQKCEVCAYVLGKENSCITHTGLTAPIPTCFILSAVKFLPHQLGNINLVAIPFDNKGPPLV